LRGASHALAQGEFHPLSRALYGGGGYFLPAQLSEGFGQVIIEAAASGLPAAASRIYGITDAVADGKTGLLFPAGDVVALTNTLLALIEDQRLRHKMGEAARVRALELFSSEQITAELIGLYEKVMDKP